MSDTTTKEFVNGPVHVMRSGSLKLSIFHNTSERGEYHSAVLSRLYTDKSTGDTRESHSMRTNDMLPSSNLVTRGYEWILQREAQSREQSKQPRKSLDARRSQERDRD